MAKKNLESYPTSWDNTDDLLAKIRGKSIRIMAKPATTQRMGWVIETLDISSAQFKKWCGLSLREWKADNASWTEKDFTDMMCENIWFIKNGDSYYAQ